MLLTRSIVRRPRFWRWLIVIVLLLLTLYSLRGEIGFTWHASQVMLAGGPSAIFGIPQLRLAFLRAIVILGGCALGLLFYLLFYFGIISQFVLPVQNSYDRWQVFERLVLYFLRWHGPAIFVQEGKEVANPEELKRFNPGVAFVDLTSAIVLERQWLSEASRSALLAGLSQMGIPGVRRLMRMVPRQMHRGRTEFPDHARVRAAGPGIVFTYWGESIRGTVSLRRQFRLKPNNKAITRDGFEVFAHVWCLYTLGERPEALKVTYTGEGAASIQTILIDEKTKTIRAFLDELDADDKEEIHRYIQNYQPAVPGRPLKPNQIDETQYWAPYFFDEHRVFQAVYAQTRLVKEGNIEDWTELPPRVAIETFRDMISVENYDDLYLPTDPTLFPLRDDFRPRMSRRVRNQGVLAYQFIRRRDGKLLAAGQPWDESKLEILPARNLTTPKVLRDRGIRVIAAGFPDIRPTNPAVFQQRFNHWQAKWQRETDLTLATYEYKSMQIRAHARAQAQRDMMAVLAQVVNSGGMTQEAVMLRILQAIETFAHEPETEKLLPKETINTLWSLHQWLLPEGGPPKPPMDGLSPMGGRS